MPRYHNIKDHPVRVRRGSGKDAVLVRLVPGQVVDADGAFADALEATNGVEQTDREAPERTDVHAGASPGIAAKRALGPLRTLVRRAIHAPLRRVVGDDAAPFGPGTGTVTTKAEAAAVSPLERSRFAPGERLPGEHLTDPDELPDPIGGFEHTSVEVETAQSLAAEEGERIATEVVDGQGDGEGPSLKGKSSGEGDFDTEDDGDGRSHEELSEECEARGLAKSGTKAELRQRLADDDASEE